MSGKKSRFEGLSVLKNSAQTAVEQSPSAEEKREALSTLIRPELKVALKTASAKEKRKVYQLVEESLEDYLRHHHPEILK